MGANQDSTEDNTHPDIHRVVSMRMEAFRVQAQKQGFDLLLPPPVLELLKTRYTEFKENSFLKAEFPFLLPFRQPAGFYQGGLIGAAFDNVFGPLCYLAMQVPCVTTEMNLQFVRPFTEADGIMDISVEVVNQSKRMIRMQGRATVQSSQKLIALAQTSCLVSTT